MITVADLIEYLEELPGDLPVAYRCFSEQLLLSLNDIEREFACAPREDGWIQDERGDMPKQEYLMFPGN